MAEHPGLGYSLGPPVWEDHLDSNERSRSPWREVQQESGGRGYILQCQDKTHVLDECFGYFRIVSVSNLKYRVAKRASLMIFILSGSRQRKNHPWYFLWHYMGFSLPKCSFGNSVLASRRRVICYLEAKRERHVRKQSFRWQCSPAAHSICRREWVRGRRRKRWEVAWLGAACDVWSVQMKRYLYYSGSLSLLGFRKGYSCLSLRFVQWGSDRVPQWLPALVTSVFLIHRGCTSEALQSSHGWSRSWRRGFDFQDACSILGYSSLDRFGCCFLLFVSVFLGHAGALCRPKVWAVWNAFLVYQRMFLDCILWDFYIWVQWGSCQYRSKHGRRDLGCWILFYVCEDLIRGGIWEVMLTFPKNERHTT